MLVVISDLHFEEVRFDRVVSSRTHREVSFDERNLSPDAFKLVFRDLASRVTNDRAKRLDLVLAGDIFDLHRTTMWLSGDVRPYVSCRDVAPGSPIEAKVLQILDEIGRDRRVAGSLSAISDLGHGVYEDGSGVKRSLDVPASITYLPGNHDRLANATPAIRARVRQLLGLPGGGDPPFRHVVPLDDPRVLVRHGHEYDRANFSRPLARDADIATELPEAAYDDWTFGDFITVEVAMGLPHTFRAVYGDDAIADDAVLGRVYLRLLQFDDVRPQSQLVPFILSVPQVDPDTVWGRLKPVVVRLLERLRADSALSRALAKGGVSPWWKGLLDTGFWRLGLPLGMVRRLGGLAGSSDDDDPVISARREVLVRNAGARFVIAGHTHRPQVAVLGAERGLEQFFVDTGTWRNAVLCSDEDGFANVKALTYVVVYGSSEDPDGHTTKDESFDYWSGFTKRW